MPRVAIASLVLLASLGHAYKCDGTTTAADVVASLNRSLTGTRIFITGGDSGLGLATAIALASVDATITIGSLFPDTQGVQAAATIKNATGSSKVTILPLDLSDFESVHACAAAYLAQSSQLDVLINDAGIDHNPSSLPPITSDGFERVFEVNYLGAFLLTELLRPALLAASAPARIINVASAAAFDACSWAGAPSDCTDLAKLPPPVRAAGNNTEGAPTSNYGLTKFLQIYHAAELAARGASRGGGGAALRAFSLHPGFVDTPMTRELSDDTKKKWCRFQSEPCPLTTDMGASTQTFLAIAPDRAIGASSGAYFTQCQEATKPKWSSSNQAELFEKSKAWAGLGA